MAFVNIELWVRGALSVLSQVIEAAVGSASEAASYARVHLQLLASQGLGETYWDTGNVSNYT